MKRILDRLIATVLCLSILIICLSNGALATSTTTAYVSDEGTLVVQNGNDRFEVFATEEGANSIASEYKNGVLSQRVTINNHNPNQMIVEDFDNEKAASARTVVCKDISNWGERQLSQSFVPFSGKEFVGTVLGQAYTTNPSWTIDISVRVYSEVTNSGTSGYMLPNKELKSAEWAALIASGLSIPLAAAFPIVAGLISAGTLIFTAADLLGLLGGPIAISCSYADFKITLEAKAGDPFHPDPVIKTGTTYLANDSKHNIIGEQYAEGFTLLGTKAETAERVFFALYGGFSSRNLRWDR